MFLTQNSVIPSRISSSRQIQSWCSWRREIPRAYNLKHKTHHWILKIHSSLKHAKPHSIQIIEKMMCHKQMRHRNNRYYFSIFSGKQSLKNLKIIMLMTQQFPSPDKKKVSFYLHIIKILSIIILLHCWSFFIFLMRIPINK